MTEKGKNIMQKKRVLEYDMLRIILSLLVVFGHSMYLQFSTTYGNMDYSFAIELLTNNTRKIYDILYFFFSWFYSFHMPMFFALSGSVFSIEREKYTDFKFLLKNKIKRLIAPYFLIGIFFMIPIKFLVGFYKFNYRNLISVFSSYFSLNLSESGQLWFIMSLFAMYIFVYFYNYIFVNYRDTKIRIIIFTFAIITIYLFNKGNDFYLLNNFARNFGIEIYFIYFIFVYIFELFRVYINDIIINNKKIFVIIMLISFFISIVNVKFGNQNLNFNIVLMPFISIYLLSFFLSRSKKFVNSTFYKFLSNKIFNIYLFHDPINFIVLFISFKVFNFSFFSTIIGFLTYYLSRTIFDMIICVLISKVYSNIFRGII